MKSIYLISVFTAILVSCGSVFSPTPTQTILVTKKLTTSTSILPTLTITPWITPTIKSVPISVPTLSISNFSPTQYPSLQAPWLPETRKVITAQSLHLLQYQTAVSSGDPVTISTNGKYLASAGSPNIPILYDFKTLAKIKLIQDDLMFRDRVFSVAFSPSADLLVSLSANIAEGNLQIWQTESRNLLYSKKTGWYYDAVFSPDGSILALGGLSEISLFDIEKMDFIRSWSVNDDFNIVSKLSFSNDGTIIVSTDPSGLKVWRVSDGELLRAIKPIGKERKYDYSGHDSHLDSQIDGMALSPDNTLIASGTIFGQIDLWRISDGIRIGGWEQDNPDGYALQDMSFSPDGTILATVFLNGVQFWEVPSGKLIKSIKKPDTAVSISFFPDGRALMIGNNGMQEFWVVK